MNLLFRRIVLANEYRGIKNICNSYILQDSFVVNTSVSTLTDLLSGVELRSVTAKCYQIHLANGRYISSVTWG